MKNLLVERVNSFIINKAKKADKVIIAGAGYIGQEMLEILKENHIYVNAFFDNKVMDKDDQRIEGIPVVKPCKAYENGCLYIIAVSIPEYRRELRLQLLELGVELNDTVACYCTRSYQYMSELDEKFYKEELQSRFFESFGRYIDWNNPVTYNEKINWEKINLKDERRTKLADKYLVKEWVKDKIGEEHVTKLYGVWDNANDIKFDELPKSFVLKVNNASALNIFVSDKSKIDREKTCCQLNEWLKINFAYKNLELHYRDIKPKIICEEYLPGLADTVYDYNIFCFHGKPKYIWCIKGSHKPDCKAAFYDLNWEMQPFSYLYPKDNILAPKPEKLDKMLEFSEILSKDFQHVRVDWYNLPDGRVLFGEMSFSSGAGSEHWTPEEYDIVFGNMI